MKQTLLLPSDRKSVMCHRMALLIMFYIMTFTYNIVFRDLDLIIQGPTFQVAIVTRLRNANITSAIR